MNSLKMKLSVIFGVTQMSLGILCKALNSQYFDRKLDFFYEFIPQITLLLCLFGWMDLLIIVKWMTPWENNESRAPGIVSVMINMFLNFGRIDTEKTDALIVSPNVQQNLSNLLLVVALLCIPVMLLIKPFFIYLEMKKQAKYKDSHDHEYMELVDRENPVIDKHHDAKQVEVQQDVNLTMLITKDEEHDDHGFGEVFIHQLIETIEFSLGTVSNTASYLRLWALSLAHGQLADVFFDKLLRTLGFEGTGSPIMLFLLFPIFATFNFSVLMCMDSMECFLHTLRLHWVEFQNKFYKGNGYKFIPFSFRTAIEFEVNNSLAK
jgi:V-type H+-transporting ATPase subunit a